MFFSFIIYSVPHILEKRATVLTESGFKHRNYMTRLIMTAFNDRVLMSCSVTDRHGEISDSEGNTAS
jgi:hypothetical protein